jgi:predicted amidohydrolase
VCYDIRFTPLAQILIERDVRLLFIPAAFSLTTGKAHWEMLVRLRAVELQAFVIGVQPAYNPSLAYIPWGHSMVASPWGDVLLDAGTSETVQVVKLDLREIEKIKAQFPLSAHRRFDLYQTIWKGGS